MDPQTELTLETLLNDPLTRAVMRSDGISMAETARVFADAIHARAARLAADPNHFAGFWTKPNS